MTLLFKIHYFLWYGSHSSIFSYESVYARYYTNASTVQFGTLRMILPFIATGITPIICLNADRRRKHRLYFTVSLIITLFALMAYTLLPLTMLIDEYESSINTSKYNSNATCGAQNNAQRSYRWIGQKATPPPQVNTQPNNQSHAHERHGGLWVAPFIYYCLITMVFDLALAVNTCLSDSYAVLQAEDSATTFGRIIVWGTFGWAFSALVLSFINSQATLARLLPGLLFGVSLLTIDSILVSLWYRDEDFKLDMLSIEAARSLTGSSSPGHRDPTDYMPFNEANLINMGTVVTSASSRESNVKRRMRIKKASEISLDSESRALSPRAGETLPEVSSRTITPRSPILSQFISPMSQASPRSPLELTISPIAPSPRSPLPDEANNDSTLSSAVKTINSDYAGPFSVPIAPDKEHDKIPDPYSRQDVFKPPVRANMVLNVSLKRAEQVNVEPSIEHKKQPLRASLKIQLSLFYLILKRRRSLVRFLIMFVLSGVFMSMQWNYFFLYLEDTYREDFEFISGLSMVGQSILGELPFFILSRGIIAKFGRSHTLSISMISIGVRFLLYRFLLGPANSMYFVFLADCLQGPNYGLFYVVMTEVGLEYSYCDNSTLNELIKMNLLDGANEVQVDAVRLALRSTVQSIAFACYEGLGVGLGGLIGGIILQNCNFDSLWFWMAVCAITLGLVNSILETTCRESDLLVTGRESAGKTNDLSESYTGVYPTDRP